VHSLASTAPLRGPFARITTIHDLAYRLVPDAHPGRLATGMELLVGAAASRSHRIIANSTATAGDIVRYLGVKPSKIDTVLLGINLESLVEPTSDDELRRRYQMADSPIVLCVAAKRPAKNLSRLIGAHARLRSPRPLLVLAGYSTPYEDKLRARAQAEGTSDDVRFLGWLPEADLEGLYRTARVFAFPSLFEGFGLPPLEAMARGLPVVTSDRGSLAEVVGDAALVVDPTSEEQLAGAIQTALTDGETRARLRSAGLARAATLTWDQTGRDTVCSYRRVLEDAAAQGGAEWAGALSDGTRMLAGAAKRAIRPASATW
jgi:glycosyltransferase involved in cell wall biosynthesis